MEFIGIASMIVVMLALTFVALCALLVVIGMCLPLFGIRSLPEEPDYDPGKRWLKAGPRP